MRNEKIVTTEKYLAHYIALIAKVFQRLLGAQVIKAINLRGVIIERHIAVTPDYFIALLDKWEAKGMGAPPQKVTFANATLNKRK